MKVGLKDRRGDGRLLEEVGFGTLELRPMKLSCLTTSTSIA